MSIRDTIYDLTKSILKSPLREDLHNLIQKLNREEYEHFGYLARQTRAQILGYLLINDKREELAKSVPFSLPPLSDFDRQYLESINRRIFILNEKCLAPLAKELPNSIKALEPYKQLDYFLPSDVPESQFLSLDLINQVANSFHSHPGISVAIDTYRAFQFNFNEEQFTKYVNDLIGEIQKVGAMHAPPVIGQITAIEGSNSPKRAMLRLISALVCVRASLHIINQLVYQAIMRDRLQLLDEDNIVQFNSHSSHFVGEGLPITYQPSLKAGLVYPGELILVKCPSSELPHEPLCEVEEFRHEFSQDFGDNIHVTLRPVDENLNPYNALLRI